MRLTCAGVSRLSRVGIQPGQLRGASSRSGAAPGVNSVNLPAGRSGSELHQPGPEQRRLARAGRPDHHERQTGGAGRAVTSPTSRW